MKLSRPRLWGQRHAARLIDGAVVAASLSLGLAGHAAATTGGDVAPLGPVTVAGAIAAATVLWWRRSRPLTVLFAGVAIAFAVGGAAAPGMAPGQVSVGLLGVCYALGSYGTRRRLGFVIAAVLALLIGAGVLADQDNALIALAFPLALVAFPLALGAAARTRRMYLHEVEARLAAAERDRDERARSALAQERTRLARELHDVVAHHVSLIGVQAGAARLALDASPETTRTALAAIEQASRDAVGEMRVLLATLRDGGGGAIEVPQPGLAALGALLDQWRAAGYDVEARTTAVDLAGLAPSLSLSCFRIVEESLSNVARHSTARRVSVAVAVSPADVRIAVTDPGPPRTPTGPVGTGRGLAGIAERATLYGGAARWGWLPGGGFVVEAVLPRRGEDHAEVGVGS